jgi:RNA polymerase sigma factor (sigma-70 family)
MTEAMAPDPAAEGASAHRPIPDDLLARRATKGDRRAFEAIYRRYHRDLYRFCLAMVGNAQDAQDALQNTMVKVLRALPGEQRQIQLKPWLYRIARNEAIETVRRRRDSVGLEPEHGSTGIELAETAEQRERLRRLIADLEELPERQRAALVMRELAGLGFEQIGETFETSPAVARQTVYEARLSLRQMEEGREMACDQVMRELSDADGRVTRRRELRAHLRGCASCRAFAESIGTRRGELAAIAPLPAALSAAMLHGILSGKASAAGLGGSAAGLGGSAAGGGAAGAAGGTAAGGAGAGTGAGGLAGTIGAGAAKAIATSAILKAAATVAVVATVGVTAADRGGLIDVPLLGGSPKSSQSSSSPPAQGEAGGAKGLETQNEAAGGGRRAAGSSRAASEAGARHGSGATTPSAGARRAGSGHRASANAHAKGRGASHRHEGLPATANHGQSTAAPHKAATRGAYGGSASHASRKAHRRTPPRHSSHHTVRRPPPPKPAPPREAPTATAPTPSPAPGEPVATGASATGSATGIE